MPEQTLRYNVELNTASAQSGLASMVQQTANSMQSAVGFAQETGQSMMGAASYGASAISGAYGSMQTGVGYAQSSFGGAFNALQGGHAQLRQAQHNASFNTTGGLHQGVINASQAYQGAMNEGGDLLPSGRKVGAAAFGAAHMGATLTGWAAASAITPKMGTLFSGGMKAGSLLGMGRVGGALMGAGTVMGGMMLPFMAADAIVGKIADDVQEQQKIADSIGAYSKNVSPLFGSGGSRFTDRERYGMAGFVQNVASNLPTVGMKGVSNILGSFGTEMMRDPSMTPGKFREAFSKKVKLVKEFAEAFDQSIDQAIQTVKVTKRLGGDTTDPRTTAAMIDISSGTSGLTTTGMVGVASRGMQTYQQLGMTPGIGTRVGIQSATDVSTMQQLGMVGRADVQAMGGVSGAGQAMTQFQANFMTGPMGQMLTAAAMRGGKVDPSAINQIISGQTPTGTMLSMSTGVAAGGLNSLSNFYANREKLTSQMSAAQQQAMVGAMAVRQLKMVGMPVNETNLTTVLRQKMPIQMARMFAARVMSPEIYDRQIQSAYNQVYQKAADREREASSWSVGKALGTKRWGNWWRGFKDDFRQDVSMPVGDFFRGLGKGWQNMKDKWTGTSRYVVNSSMYDPWTIAQQTTTEDDQKDQQRVDMEVARRKSSQIVALVNRMKQTSDETGTRLAPWAKKIWESEQERKTARNVAFASTDPITGKMRTTSGRDAASRSVTQWYDGSDVSKALKGVRQADREIRDVIYGHTNAKTVKSSNEKLFQSRKLARIAQLHVGKISNEDPRTAATRISKALYGASLAEISSEQRQVIGAFLKDQQADVNLSKGIMGNIDATQVQVTQEMAEDAESKIGTMVSNLSLPAAFGKVFSAVWNAADVIGGPQGKGWAAIHANRPVTAIFGVGSGRAAAQADTETKVDVAEITSILIKGSRTPAETKRLKVLAQQVREKAGAFKGDRRKGLMKIVNAAISGRFATQKERNVANHYLNSGMPAKMMDTVKTYRKWRAKSASNTIGLEFTRRLSVEMMAAGKQRKYLERFAKVRKISGVGKFLAEIQDLPMKGAAGLSKRILDTRKKYVKQFGDQKFKSMMTEMKKMGGAYGKAANLMETSKTISDLGHDDLLANVSDKVRKEFSVTNVRGKLKKLNQIKDMSTRKKEIKKFYDASLKRALSGARSEKEKKLIRTTLSKMSPQRALAALTSIIGKQRGTGSEQRALLNFSVQEAAAKSGRITGARAEGTTQAMGMFSAVAQKQISMMDKYISSLQTQQQLMNALHNSILARFPAPKK